MLYRASSPEETEALGARLAVSHPPLTEGPAVIYLTGDLGAGKTTLARGFLRACGVTGSVRSPTYTLVESYEARIAPAGGKKASEADDAGEEPAFTVLHLDLYRLRDPSELDALGVREWARAGYLWLVEWPDRGEGYLPPADLLLELRACEPAHEILINPLTSRGQAWVSRLD